MVRLIKAKYEAFKLKKYYQSIKECPMYNWIELYEKSDITQLSKTGKVCKRAESVYEKLQDEIINEFGINEDFLRILKLKIQIELLYAEQIESGNKSNQIFIDIKEIDCRDLMNKQTKIDLFETIIAIEKSLGFKINPKRLTVFEFYKYQKVISNRLKHEIKNK
jgi:hypothetical protein